MKKLIVLLSLVLSTTAFAGLSVNEKSLALLLKTNPTVTDYQDKPTALLNAITPYMITSLDEENRGVLGTVANTCELENEIYSCRLVIGNSDVELDDNGNYNKPEDATESGVHVIYKVDQNVQKIIGEVEIFFAG